MNLPTNFPEYILFYIFSGFILGSSIFLIRYLPLYRARKKNLKTPIPSFSYMFFFVGFFFIFAFIGNSAFENGGLLLLFGLSWGVLITGVLLFGHKSKGRGGSSSSSVGSSGNSGGSFSGGGGSSGGGGAGD